ncbi:hypothetical protein MUY14_42740 [Amycolatopsis sp. FBCC-B4732]|uniref:hypothetical protein n=1 Tax=Amycolatopsis sp. FBCC-B4732 TaxID=3079339 RepID=UPI001FF470E4|nr:hypothetical protein [Amycolatopsis sp. FBCC-B4732]UOX88334.1 hypothetical protein MUY14_42740 [Amycolatopsis sp. FBCC-B4732]
MILRTELRRSIAPWAGLALVVVALGFLFLLSGPWWKAPASWTAHSTTAALWLRFLLVFLWPIVVGAGAIQGMRDSRSGVVELLATTSRPGWQRAARPAGAVGGLSVAGYLVVFAVGAVEILAHGGFFSLGFLPVLLVGSLGVLAGSWLGLAVGRLLPHPLAAPGAAVLAFVLTVLCWMSLESGLEPVLPTRVGPLAPSLAEPRGEMVTTTVALDLGQGGWFLGLAVTSFLLLSARSVRARLLGLLPLVAGAAVALPLFPAVPADALTTDSVAGRKVCDGPICVSELHRDRLAALRGPGREALAMLAKLPDPPTRIEEQVRPPSVTGPAPRDPHVVSLDFQRNDLLLTAGADDLRLAVLTGAGVPSCEPPSHSSVPDQAARAIGAAYFTGKLEPLPEFTRNWFKREFGAIEQVWNQFRALPPDVQATRIVALRQALLTCRGEPLDVLVPGALR